MQDRTAEIEYNKRQLLFHIERARKRPDSDDDENLKKDDYCL